VLPSLALAIGLNEAIVLQQIHYWLQRSRHTHDDRKWIYNTFEEWQAQFPWWSLRTVKTIIGNLERENLLIVGNYNTVATDRTKWYAINYMRLAKIANGTPVGADPDADAAPSIVQDLHDATGNDVPLQGADLAPSSIEQETTTREIHQEDVVFVDQVALALEDEGITPAEARRLAERDPDLAAAWLDAETWRIARDPAALLVAKIRAGEQPPRKRDPWAAVRRQRA